MPALHIRFRPDTKPRSALFNDRLTALIDMDLDELLANHGMGTLAGFSDDE